MPRLVLLGGGHSHIEVLRRAALKPLSADILLVDPHPALPYTGMVPGYIAGIYPLADILIDLTALCARAGATLIRASAIGIDIVSRQIHCDNGRTIDYDLLSLDVGSTLDASVPGACEYPVRVRPLWHFVHAWPEVAKRGRRMAVVGAGTAGIELALAIHANLSKDGDAPQVSVVGDAPHIAPGVSRHARRQLQQACAARGIRLQLGQRVAQATSDHVVLDDGATISADAIVWATGPAAQPWLRKSGLALDDRGYLAVDAQLRVGGRSDVYAAGDAASIIGHPRPRAGVYAVREAPVLADNLRRTLLGEPLRTYVPQPRALALIGTGDGRAVATYGALWAEGRWVWRWKDAIDRRFVQRYRE